MTKITRRSFLKGAGVAALAVAAAGVMTGCAQDNVPGTDIPNAPTVTSKEVTLFFFDESTSEQIAGANKTMSVLKDAKVVNTADIPAELIPEDYHIAKEAALEIREHAENDLRVYVWVTRDTLTPTTKEITVKLMITNPELGENMQKEITVIVPADATTVSVKQITLPEGFAWAEGVSEDMTMSIESAMFAVKHV